MLSIFLVVCLVRLNDPSSRTDVFDVVSLSASLAAALGLSLLLFLEQRRSAGPSDLAVLYLLACVGSDVMLLTMPAQGFAGPRVQKPAVMRLSLYSALLLLETAGKGCDRLGESPEESHGVLSRAFFTWINPILLKGYRTILVQDDLPPVRSDMRPERTREAMIRAWNERGRHYSLPVLKFMKLTARQAKPESRWALPVALLRCVRKPFLAAVVPRLFLIAFRYAQPILIQQSIRFVTVPSESAVAMRGYWLVVAVVVVYLGLAVGTRLFN